MITCNTWHMTCDTWHVTHDTWHVTHDMWHVTQKTWHVTGCGGWIFSQDFSSLALTVCDLWYFKDLEEKADWLTESISQCSVGGICRTAPATLGVLMKLRFLLVSEELLLRLDASQVTSNIRQEDFHSPYVCHAQGTPPPLAFEKRWTGGPG